MKANLFLLFLLLTCLSGYSQLFKPAKKYSIDTLQILETYREGKIKKSFKSDLLREGYNFLAVEDDRILYIEVKKNKIESFVLTKNDGTVLEKMKINSSGPFRFSCGWLGCICTGTADCNDLESTGLCGATICVDNLRGTGQRLCICLRA